MKSSCKMKVIFCDYNLCVCIIERGLLAGFCVICVTDSAAVIVSSTAGSKASLSY